MAHQNFQNFQSFGGNQNHQMFSGNQNHQMFAGNQHQQSFAGGNQNFQGFGGNWPYAGSYDTRSQYYGSSAGTHQQHQGFPSMLDFGTMTAEQQQAALADPQGTNAAKYIEEETAKAQALIKQMHEDNRKRMEAAYHQDFSNPAGIGAVPALAPIDGSLAKDAHDSDSKLNSLPRDLPRDPEAAPVATNPITAPTIETTAPKVVEPPIIPTRIPVTPSSPVHKDEPARRGHNPFKALSRRIHRPHHLHA